MDPENNDAVVAPTDISSHLTTVACVAAIIDITTKALSSIDGDGIELIGSDGTSITADGLHDLVSSFTYRAINDNTVSHDVVQGSIDYV